MDDIYTPFSDVSNMTEAESYLSEHPDIKADWFKFDSALAGFAVGLCRDAKRENPNTKKEEWYLEGAYSLGVAMYAVSLKLISGDTNFEVDKYLNQPTKALERMIVERASQAMETGRVKIAQNRVNALKKNSK